jgi:hypothetical protein
VACEPEADSVLRVRYELHPGYYDKGGDIGNFDPSVSLAGKVIYPTGKESLLAQSFLASANACDPDGVTATNSATVNGAPCMQVVGNQARRIPLRPEAVSEEALHAALWLRLPPIRRRQVGHSRGL